MSHTILFSFSQFSSVQSLDRLGRWGDTRDDSAEILFRSFLQEALVSSSGMGRDVRLESVEDNSEHDLAGITD